MGVTLGISTTATNPLTSPNSPSTAAELRRCLLEIDHLKLCVQELLHENRVLKESSQRDQATLPCSASSILVQSLSAQDVESIVCSAALGNNALPTFKGSFGEVFKGHVPLVEAPVAVKLAHLDADRRDWHECFLRELQLQKRVQSHHLVPLLTVCPARLALVYPWAAHGSLHDWLLATPPPPKQGLQFLMGAARGLSALHSRGLVHCDFRSVRVLLFDKQTMGDTDGDIAAQLSGCGHVRVQDIQDRSCQAGTVRVPPLAKPYSDPFHLLTGHVIQASDMFSFGVVLLEVLLGRSAAGPVEPEDGAVAMQTRRPRPMHLWQQFHRELEKCQRRSGEPFPTDAGHCAAEAILQLLPSLPWEQDARLAASALVFDLLEVAATAGQDGDTLQRAVAPPIQGQQPPHRPQVAEVVERLEVACALQVAPASAGPRERLCIICMDAQVDARLVPCGHAVLCESCASLCVGRKDRCPICRGAADAYDKGDFQSTFAISPSP